MFLRPAAITLTAPPRIRREMKAFSHYFRRVSPFATTPTEERSGSRPSDTVVGAADKSNPYSNDLAMMDGEQEREAAGLFSKSALLGKLDSLPPLILLLNDGKDTGLDSKFDLPGRFHCYNTSRFLILSIFD